MISQASSPEEANARLAHLLVEKGLISQQEYTATVTPVSTASSEAHLSDAVLHTSSVLRLLQPRRQHHLPLDHQLFRRRTSPRIAHRNSQARRNDSRYSPRKRRQYEDLRLL